MRLTTILLIYAAILIGGYLAGKRKAARIAFSRGTLADMHSLPSYHGYNVMLWGAIPALLVIVAYLVLADGFAVSRIVANLPESLAGVARSAAQPDPE